MGDSGSMFLGFTLACIAILGSWETEKISLSLFLPILILGYPIFDTTLVTFLRIRERRPIFLGGKDHSSHILASLGLKKKRAVLIIYLICVLLGLSALVISSAQLYTAVSTLIVAAGMILGIGVYLAAARSKSAKVRRGRGEG